MMVMRFWKELDWGQKVFVGMVSLFLFAMAGVSIVFIQDGVFASNPVLLILFSILPLSVIMMLVDILRY